MCTCVKTEFFVKIVYGIELLTIFTKNITLDFLQGSEYSSDMISIFA